MTLRVATPVVYWSTGQDGKLEERAGIVTGLQGERVSLCVFNPSGFFFVNKVAICDYNSPIKNRCSKAPTN